jgi:hypothetical protein
VSCWGLSRHFVDRLIDQCLPAVAYRVRGVLWPARAVLHWSPMTAAANAPTIQ